MCIMIGELRHSFGRGIARLKALHNSPPDGVHYLLESFGCKKEQLDSLLFWKKILSKAIADSGIKVLNKHFYKFSPHGITGYLLLSASHISIHTWQEYSYLTCDVFSCGGDDEASDIVKYIRANICHEKVRKRKLKRGFRISSEKQKNYLRKKHDASRKQISN